MNPQSCLEQLRPLIMQVTQVPIGEEAIVPETTLADELGLDSIGLVTLIALCEESFGVELASDTERLGQLATVGDAVTFLLEKAGAGS